MTLSTRPISWIKAALNEFEKFPQRAQSILLNALTIAAEGGKSDIAKPMHGLGSGVFEIALPFRGDAYRVIYAVQIAEEVWVIHAFQKKSTRGIQNRKAGHRFDPRSFEQTEGDVEMKSHKVEVVRGSGNVFRDFGHDDADVKQFKAILAAEIVKSLDRQELTVRAAHDRTGIAAADFSRIRNADLSRFTVDRLISIINRLGSRVELKIKLRPAKPAA